jgi:hypothetical protein
MILGFLPYIGDGFPRSWPKTIDSVASLEFDNVLPGHGPLQSNRQTMTNERNYIEELTGKVAAGRDAGRSLGELQKTITVASLKSLQSNGYAGYVTANYAQSDPGTSVENAIKTNVAEVYKNLDRI